MTPTIVLKDGKLFMTAGAPGGSRISTAVLQVILNVIDFGMNVQDAIDAPRVHHQWQPDKLSLERGISPDTVALLKSARLRRRLRAGRRPRAGRRHRQRRRLAAGRVGRPLGGGESRRVLTETGIGDQGSGIRRSSDQRLEVSDLRCPRHNLYRRAAADDRVRDRERNPGHRVSDRHPAPQRRRADEIHREQHPPSASAYRMRGWPAGATRPPCDTRESRTGRGTRPRGDNGPVSKTGQSGDRQHLVGPEELSVTTVSSSVTSRPRQPEECGVVSAGGRRRLGGIEAWDIFR